MTMTEEQMRHRMKEIDEERDKLRDERKTYENYFYDQKLKEKYKDHKQFEGKCFLTKGQKENKCHYVKAFKIVKVLDTPNENMAQCVVLIDGHRSNVWDEYGIQIMTLGLWSQNTVRLMFKEADPKMIDFYEEISEEKFENLYREYSNNIEDNAYK